MDALSQFIQLTRPQASLDLRCLFQGPFSVPHDAAPEGQVLFHLVLAGSCLMESGGRTFPLREGDFILFPRGHAHTLQVPARTANTPDRKARGGHNGMLPLRQTGRGAAEVDLLCGRFVHGPGSTTLLVRTLPDPLHVSLRESAAFPALQAVIELMRQEAGARAPGALAIVTSLSQALLTLALRVHGQRQDAAPGTLTLLSDARLGPSVQAMLTTPERAWTLDALAELAAMSRATYARHFKARAAMTMWEFLTRVRMTLACNHLLHGQDNVGEIGERIGYRSEAAFGKAFKQHLGTTPARYRRSNSTSGPHLDSRSR
ncbi:AraC family transcriptional regulator [Corallococcus sp. M34]|uniref:cupin domain-containing protein n=1 Tax=Citreicoccus inhibens TaxID=2849499 RepID=UPI001C234D63|nr:AraC family transcriptional regulator [Citreicoccus inhibens]MBU8899582.1 AraC family transcriptional regulator [Citreicoccus inhibens]